MSYEQLTKQATALREANIEILRLRALVESECRRAEDAHGESQRASLEIARLQEAKRRAAAIADERSKENVGLRAENERLQTRVQALCGVLEVHKCNARPNMTVGECIKSDWGCNCSCGLLIVPH